MAKQSYKGQYVSKPHVQDKDVRSLEEERTEERQKKGRGQEAILKEIWQERDV